MVYISSAKLKYNVLLKRVKKERDSKEQRCPSEMRA